MKPTSLFSSISFISGWHTTQPEFPPYFYNLASESPIVLETDSLPGNTLNGP